jgi:hypothetical protein
MALCGLARYGLLALSGRRVYKADLNQPWPERCDSTPSPATAHSPRPCKSAVDPGRAAVGYPNYRRAGEAMRVRP